MRPGHWPSGVLVSSSNWITSYVPQLERPCQCFSGVLISSYNQPDNPTGIQTCIQSIRYAENQWLTPAIRYTVKHAYIQSIMHTISQPDNPTGIQTCIQSIRYAENQWLAPAITYTVKHVYGQSIMHTTSQPVGHIWMLHQSSIILQVAIHAVIHVHAHMQ